MTTYLLVDEFRLQPATARQWRLTPLSQVSLNVVS
jgi:hypothetical protein